MKVVAMLLTPTLLPSLPQWVMEHVVNSEECHVLSEQLADHPRGSYEDEEILAAGIHLASIAEKKRLWLRNAALDALFIGSWSVTIFNTYCMPQIYILLYRFFFATLLSVYNKWMFGRAHFGFPAPVFVTTFHIVIQFCLAAALRTFWPERFRPPENPTPRDYVCVMHVYDYLPNLVLCK